jgi:hypothetical protein
MRCLVWSEQALQEGGVPAPVVSKEVPRKTKQKVNKKIQFLESMSSPRVQHILAALHI